MEKNNKKLEDFFQKRLLENKNINGVVEGPPAFIWDNAQPSFPNRKKKNRKFLFWLIPAVLLTLGGLGILLNGNIKNTQLVTAEISKSKEQISSDIDEIVAEKAQQRLSVTQKNEKILVPGNVQKTESITKPNTPLKTSFKKQNHKINSQPIEEPNGFLIKSTFNEDLAINQLNKSLIDKDGVEKNKLEYIDNVKIEDLNRVTKRIGVLSLILPFDKDPVFEPPFIKMVTKKQKLKNEVGLSSNRFVESPFELNEEDEQSELILKSKYYNLNLEYRREIHRNWYFASALNFSQIKANFKYTEQIPFFGGDQTSLLRSDLYSYTNLTVGIDENEENIPLEFLPDLNIPLGSPVVFNLDFGIKISALEVPLELNYHFDRGKWEFLMGGGISLNYYRYLLETEPIKVFYEGDVISQNVAINDIKLNEFNWGITTYAGIKYKFSKQINAGLYCRIEPFDLVMARFGLGLYYRY